jgi:hypothetical protein
MRANRVFQGIIVGAAVAALSVAGCKKDEDSAEGGDNGNGDEAKTQDRKGDDSASAASGELPAGTSYANFPADSEMLFGVSFGAVRSSALWDKYRDMVIAGLDSDGELAEFQEACGFDPFTKLESVMFGGSTADDDRMVVVVHGFSRDEIATCGEGVAGLEDEEFNVTDDGKLSHYTVGEEELWVAWLDDRTLMTGPRAETDKEWLASRASGENGLAADSELASLVEGLDRAAGVWFGMIPADDSPMGGGMAMAGGPQPEAIYGSVAPSDGVSISTGVRFSSADEANEVLTQAQQMLQMVKLQAGDLGKFIDKAEMSTEDADMLVRIALSEQDLTELVDSMGAMFGGMFGMQ